MAGYEAKAVVTADMSGFIRASQDAARAAEQLANALRDVNTQLRSFTDSGRDVARALAPLARASQQAANSANDTADAQSRLSSSTRDAVDNIDRASQAQQRSQVNTRSLARTWVQASDSLESLNSALASGTRDQNNINESLNTARRVYGQVNSQLDTLTDTQRQSFDQQVAELRLRQQVNTAVRDTTQSLQLEGRQRELTRTQISNLAREYTRLVGLQRQLATLSESGAVLGQQDVAAMTTFSQRLREISSETDRFSDAQRRVFDSTVRTTAATEQAAQAKRRLAASEREAASSSTVSAQAENQRVQSLERLGRSLFEAETAADRARTAMQSLSQPTAEQARTFQQTSQRLSELRQQYSTLSSDQRAIAQATLDTARSQADYNRLLREGASAARESASAFSQQRQSLFTIRSAIGDLESVVGGWNDALLQVGITIGTVFSQQEVAIAHLSRVTQETDVFIDQMTTSLREMSTQIPIAFTELARIGQIGAQVGVANERLVEFTRTVALFAATTDVSADQASIMFARIAELSDVPDDEISNLGAAVSALGSHSAATESQILRTTEQIATIGRQAGLTVTTVAGLASAMASLGIRPELARGALQRTLFEIEQAATGASSKTQGFADVMGLTVDEMVALREEVGREEFLSRFGEALEQASLEGQDLNTVLRDIGFRNVQDVQVLAALGANWGFVAEQINRASTEYTANNFLQREASRLFDTVTAQVITAVNAWQNAAAAIGQLFAPFALGVARVAQSLGEFVASSRAAQGAIGAFLVLGTVVTSLTLLASTLGIVVFSLRQLGPVLALAAAGFARLRTAVAGFAATMALIARTNPVGLFLTFVAAVTALTVAWRRHSAAARESGREILRANEANFAAAGGIETLQEAVRQDTEAWREHGDSVALSVRTLDQTATAQRAAAEEAQATSTRVGELSEQVDVLGRSSREASTGMVTLSDSATGLERIGPLANDAAQGAQSAAESTGVLERALAGVAQAAENNRFAVGLATLAWSQAAFEAELMSSALVESEQLFNDVMATGVDFGAALVLEMQNAGDGVQHLRDAADAATGGMSQLERGIVRASGPARTFAREVLGINHATADFMLRQVEAHDVLSDAADTLQGVSLQTQIAAAMNQVMTETVIDLGNGTSVTAAQVAELGEETARATATLNGTSITLQDLNEAFSSLVDPAGIVGELISEAATAAEEAGVSFDQLGAEALPEFNSRVREAQVDMVDFGNDLLAIANESGPEAVAALLGMGEAGVDMANALEEALATGNIDDFNTAINNINMDAAVASISESFSRILAAPQDARDELLSFWADLQQQLAAGDITLDEFASRLQAELDRVLGDVEVDISAEIDESEMIQRMEEALQRIADAVDPPEVEIGVDDTEGRNRFAEFIAWLTQQLSGTFLPSISPEVDSEGMTTAFSSAMDILRNLATSLAPVVIPGLNPFTAREAMSSLMGFLRRLASGDVTAIPGVNRSPATSAMRGLMGTLARIARTAISIFPAVATGGPVAAMYGLMRTLRAIASGGVFIPTTVGKGISGRGRLADGGWVRGPGGPRADRIPAMLSAGEFVVRASQARLWAPLLADINEGAIPNPGIPGGRVPSSPTVPTLTSDLRSARGTGSSAMVQMMRRAQASGAPQRPGTMITVNNTYPQAEPTSVTINRSLAYKSVLDGVGPA